MKNMNHGIYQDRLFSVFKHVGYIHEITEEMKRFADHRGLLEFDGYVRQAISGKFNLTKSDTDRLIRLCDLYDIIKFNPRTNEIKLMQNGGGKNA
ncbi:MAG: hypothetical protein NT120_04715 [Candidatus Aenigmarchaeota archaeon]|nr:hypothetical protein [Candidatus Aenigmarchaeota archaeon]